MTPELSRPLPLERIGAAGAEMVVEANAAECAAVAARLGVPVVRSLRCRFVLTPVTGDRFEAVGDLRAVVERTCVVSLDEFDETVGERFTAVFVPEDAAAEEIDPADIEAPDEITYAGHSIDLGEAAVEQLALALDPYPRKPGAELSAGPEGDPAGPFAALSGWNKPR